MNTKLYFFALSLLVYFTNAAQSKELSIKLEDDKSFIRSYFNDNENLYFYVAKPPSGIMYVFKNDELLCFDNNLEKKFSVNLNKRYNDGEHKFSKSSNYYLNIDEIIDENGDKREYPLGRHYGRLTKKSKLNPIFKFYNGYAYTAIGPEIGRRNRKKSYEGNDIKIFNLRNSDLEEETFTLQIPAIKSNQDTPSWFLGEKFDNSFYLTSKDNLDKKAHTDNYHIVENGYNGELKSYANLSVNLDDNKFFLFSMNTENIGPIDEAELSFIAALSYGYLHVDRTENTYTVYGYYSDKSKRNEPKIKKNIVSGFYIFKFQKDGELIWKKYYPFASPTKLSTAKRKIEYIQSADKGVILSYLGDYNGIFVIDPNNGNILKTSKDLVDFFDKKKVLDDNLFLNLDMYSTFSGGFLEYFKDKKTNKNKINYKVLPAFLLKPEIKDFILKKASKLKNAKYSSYYLKDGSIIIKERIDGSNINLYKF